MQTQLLPQSCSRQTRDEHLKVQAKMEKKGYFQIETGMTFLKINPRVVKGWKWVPQGLFLLWMVIFFCSITGPHFPPIFTQYQRSEYRSVRSQTADRQHSWSRRGKDWCTERGSSLCTLLPALFLEMPNWRWEKNGKSSKWGHSPFCYFGHL